MRSSLVYPVLLVCVTLGVVIGLFVFVLPSFFTMFEGAEVPPITRGVMAVSGFLTNRWYLVVVAVLLLGLGWIFLSGCRVCACGSTGSKSGSRSSAS